MDSIHSLNLLLYVDFPHGVLRENVRASDKKNYRPTRPARYLAIEEQQIFKQIKSIKIRHQCYILEAFLTFYFLQRHPIPLKGLFCTINILNELNRLVSYLALLLLV